MLPRSRRPWSHVAPRDLHLLPAAAAAAPRGALQPCRTCGCEAPAHDRLGFCAVCRIEYDERSIRRGRFRRAVCSRLAAAGDPLFVVFGGRDGTFGAHVAGHLEAFGAARVHVPPAAVRDYIEELDEFAHRSA